MERREFLKRGAAAGLSLAIPACASRSTSDARGGAPGGAGEADLILTGGRITTLDPRRPAASAAVMGGGRFLAVGSDEEALALRGPRTRVVDLRGRRVIPGLIDSHLHLIRGGLNFNLELRWEGVPSLADALRLLRRQAARTPPPQWVRVVGGFSELQFAEKRLPTLDELNEAAPETPVFILHLYDRALLNRAALRAVGYGRDTPEPPGGAIERDANGEPTGLLIAKPNATILYRTLSMGPKLSPEDQVNSTRIFLREMNRLGLTGAIDAGGGFQNYPQDYRVIEDLHRRGELTVRLAYNLFTQNPGAELEDFRRWTSSVRPGQGDDLYRLNGAGEMLAFSAADFEDFIQPRPDLPAEMEGQLGAVVRLLAERGWPFRLHATYEESIARFLDVLESVHREVPVDRLRWFLDHAETISPRSIERVKALGGGIAVQHRMAYQGERFIERYGERAAGRAPPIREMLRAGIPLGAGTDGTRVASYNPWAALHWLVTGRTVGGTSLYPEGNRLGREEALALYTRENAWFSGESGKKGFIAPGLPADLAVLSADYLTVPEAEIPGIESVLTVVGGKPVHGAEEHRVLAPPVPPASPDWSPVNLEPSSGRPRTARGERPGHAGACAGSGMESIWGGRGCDCFVF